MVENNISFIDSTLQLRLKLTKEKFNNCSFLDSIRVSVYTVQIGSDESKWAITIWPKGDREHEEDNVVIALECLDGDKDKYSVLYDFRIETSSGYWPDNFIEKLFSKRSLHGFVDFDPSADNDPDGSNFSFDSFRFSSTEDFRKQFVDDEVTLVGTLVIDMEPEGKSDRNHSHLADEFTNDMRSLSLLDDMYDFTIICDWQHFPCHKTLLASRSEFFRGMFRHLKMAGNTKTDMEVNDSSPEIVKTVLDFMSNGLLPSEIDAKAKEMIHLADMFGLKGLTNACVVSLVKSLSPENATETLTIVDEHAPNSEDRSKILEYIKKEASQVVKTQHWKTFVQNYPDLVTDILLTPCSHD